jgi:uncharacterized membrane protein YvlD (DUF360 family)
MVLVAEPPRLNTDPMQFSTRLKSPQQFLFSSLLAGVFTAAITPVILVRWLLRIPFLSLGIMLRVVGGCVVSIWWSAALFLIAHGNSSVGHQIRSTAGHIED